jgi:mannosyl-oligosaccharide alpha-1,2-mannosidase
MGFDEDFGDCVDAIEKIDFTTSTLEVVNVFETTIRHLGGLLAAYDLSRGRYPVLLKKAVELGNMLYVAFDTANHMPNTRWRYRQVRDRRNSLEQLPPDKVSLAEIGSLTLEFTRLSQITGDPKYFDAVQRVTDILELSQDKTRIPGIWPMVSASCCIDEKLLVMEFH